MRLTLQTRLLLSALGSGGGREWYGGELVTETGLPQGTVYPMLARLESAGWLAGRAEEESERGGQARPPRRYVRLTEAGRAMVSMLPSVRVSSSAIKLEAAS